MNLQYPPKKSLKTVYIPLEGTLVVVRDSNVEG